MPLRRWWDNAAPLAGAPGVRILQIAHESWHHVAEDVAAGGGRLAALWTHPAQEAQGYVRAVMLLQYGVLMLSSPVRADADIQPGIEDLFPGAGRLQRAAADLTGVRFAASDVRPWLRHAAWRADQFPLRTGETWAPEVVPRLDDYPFVRVEGEGVHEVPVGPVHAGIIEPGHFRFSIVGEKVLRLEQRLGYVHKGIERRFTELSILEAHRLAARISGDCAVAFSWAYCQALEGMTGVSIPARAAWLRALALELERIANHLGDLGMLGNDAGFAFGHAQFSRLKEQVLRATSQAFNQRYLMDFVVPGGTAVDLTPSGTEMLERVINLLVHEVRLLREIYDEHEGVRDRFAAAGTVTPTLARQLGVIGLVGRASGLVFDLRVDAPCAPYQELAVAPCTRAGGDVLARVALRFDEVMESCRLIQKILLDLPDGIHRTGVSAPPDGVSALGIVEGWRGPVLIALDAGPEGSIRRCHPQEPSSLNWLALEHAIIGNIVPDFPLINKSFNLSYSGHDL